MLVAIEDWNGLACALSIGPFKRIFVGPAFFKLPVEQQMAVYYHEKGHCDGHHLEWRILCALLNPFALTYICRKQELWADRYAWAHGFGPALIDFLNRTPRKAGWFHPPTETRVARVTRYLARCGVTDQRNLAT